MKVWVKYIGKITLTVVIALTFNSCMNPSGTLKWKYKTGGSIWSSPAIGSDGTIYVGSWDGNLYAINPVGTLK